MCKTHKLADTSFWSQYSCRPRLSTCR